MSAAEDLRVTELPHSLQAERAVLGAMLLDAEAVATVAPMLYARDFYKPAHALIFEAVTAVARRGDPVELGSVSQELHDRDRLETVGGMQYLGDLQGRVSNTLEAAGHARVVARTAAQRRAATYSAEAAQLFAAGETDRAAKLAARATEEATRGEGTAPLSPAARARALGQHGAHLPTGIETLDAATRGGPRRGDTLIAAGAPGSGKTTLATNVAMRYSIAGHRVAILASDEGADGLLIRMGQCFGLDRDALEAGDPEAREELAQRLEEQCPHLMLADAADGFTVEGVAARLRDAAKGEPAVLVVDSVQTAPAFGTEGAESPKARVDAVMHALKAAARAGGMLVIATCEVNRGSYRSRDPGQRVDDLAAFKESGSIEYGATTTLLLRNVPDDPELVDVAMPKNRAGQRMDFRLRLNRVTAEFREVAMPAQPDPETARENAAAQKLAKVREQVLDAVRRHPGISSKRAIVAHVGGRRELVFDAIAALLSDGELTEVRGAGFRVVPGGSRAGGTGSETVEAPTRSLKLLTDGGTAADDGADRVEEWTL